jgi:hypothetical protein
MQAAKIAARMHVGGDGKIEVEQRVQRSIEIVERRADCRRAREARHQFFTAHGQANMRHAAVAQEFQRRALRLRRLLQRDLIGQVEAAREKRRAGAARGGIGKRRPRRQRRGADQRQNVAPPPGRVHLRPQTIRHRACGLVTK